VREVTGTLSVTRQGDGFVRGEEGGPDVFVPAEGLAGAMDGDTVVARVEGRPRGRNPEGSVVRVLERARQTVVGTLHRTKKVSFVVPLDRRLHGEVVVLRSPTASGSASSFRPRWWRRPRKPPRRTRASRDPVASTEPSY
jgi:exoribonuclease R